jgi:hypothetical protein
MLEELFIELSSESLTLFSSRLGQLLLIANRAPRVIVFMQYANREFQTNYCFVCRIGGGVSTVLDLPDIDISHQ